MTSMPEKPEKPLKDDCCGSGSCYLCVWDVYYEKLAEWKEAKRELDAKNASNSGDR